MSKEKIIIIILTISFAIVSLFNCMCIAIINDKTDTILKYKNERDEAVSDLEDLLQKYVQSNHKLDKYKRVCGEIDG